MSRDEKRHLLTVWVLDVDPAVIGVDLCRAGVVKAVGQRVELDDSELARPLHLIRGIRADAPLVAGAIGQDDREAHAPRVGRAPCGERHFFVVATCTYRGRGRPCTKASIPATNTRRNQGDRQHNCHQRSGNHEKACRRIRTTADPRAGVVQRVHADAPAPYYRDEEQPPDKPVAAQWPTEQRRLRVHDALLHASRWRATHGKRHLLLGHCTYAESRYASRRYGVVVATSTKPRRARIGRLAGMASTCR